LADKLIEDIVEVTETLMDSDQVDIDALAHVPLKPSLNERAGHGKHHKWGGYNKWKKHKEHERQAKMKEQEESGVFKRGVC
jgi:hypothetical protein